MLDRPPKVMQYWQFDLRSEPRDTTMPAWQCPNCSFQMHLPENWQGSPMNCYRCGSRFSASTEELPPAEQKGPLQPAQTKQEFRDAFEPESSRMPSYPVLATIAGAAWIGIGSLVLASFLINVVMTVRAMFTMGVDVGLGGFTCFTILAGLFGAAFLSLGIQTVRVAARDTLGNSIASLVFGAFFLLGAAATLGDSIPMAFVTGMFGAALVTAGILALVGRDTYKVWRSARNQRQDRLI